jgi:hypothetical protein
VLAPTRLALLARTTRDLLLCRPATMSLIPWLSPAPCCLASLASCAISLVYDAKVSRTPKYQNSAKAMSSRLGISVGAFERAL